MKNDIRLKKLNEGEIVPISFDYHFIRIFGDKENMDIIEYFISDFYNIPIEDVTGNIEILSRDLSQDSRSEKRKQVDLFLKHQEQIEMAKKILEEKLDINIISRITGLSKEEIKKL